MSLANKTFIGEVIKANICLTEQEIVAGAEFIGDKNPIHYNLTAAKSAGFNSIIASGGHSSSLFVATLTQYFENSGNLMGLENQFFFKKPVIANQQLKIEWITEKISPNSRLNGDIVTFKGKMFNNTKDVVLLGKAKVLFLKD